MIPSPFKNKKQPTTKTTRNTPAKPKPKRVSPIQAASSSPMPNAAQGPRMEMANTSQPTGGGNPYTGPDGNASPTGINSLVSMIPQQYQAGNNLGAAQLISQAYNHSARLPQFANQLNPIDAGNIPAIAQLFQRMAQGQGNGGLSLGLDPAMLKALSHWLLEQDAGGSLPPNAFEDGGIVSGMSTSFTMADALNSTRPVMSEDGRVVKNGDRPTTRSIQKGTRRAPKKNIGIKKAEDGLKVYGNNEGNVKGKASYREGMNQGQAKKTATGPAFGG